MKHAIKAAMAITGLLLAGTAAHADITACNDFQVSIRVALASQDQDKFTSQGWWMVAPGQCVTTDFAFDGQELYYAADSDPYLGPTGDLRQHWGNKYKLYVSAKKFTYDNARQSRPGAKAEMFGMGSIPQGGPGKAVKITLRFFEGNTSVTVKTGP